MLSKVHSLPAAVALGSGDDGDRERETFTIWMKSLVLHGAGCAVYDSVGRLVYRVDNYARRCSSTVYLMDLAGDILIKILKKKMVYGTWEGYKCWGGTVDGKHEPPAPSRTWFTVKKRCGMFRSSWCEFRCDAGDQIMCYRIEDQSQSQSSTMVKFIDQSNGVVVAEVRRKRTATGIALGDDVLSLAVEPDVSRPLIVGLVVVLGLMNRTL